MRKNINTQHIEGRIYQHNLTLKTVQNQKSANFGKEFITGNLEIATDENGLNVLPVHFTYITEITKKGVKSSTFTTLKKIIDEGKSWVTSGKDNATKVAIDNVAIALNDFYTQDDTLVSAKVNEGGFASIVTDLHDEGERNTFTADMVITKVTTIEANEDKGIEKDYLSVRGAIFNFKNDLLPFDFVVKNPAGIKYFENLGATPAEPVYTKIWGKIICSTIMIPHTEESAFGEAIVTNSARNAKEWVITGAAKIPYDFGDETVLTRDDLTKAMQNREIYLAEKKKQSDEYRANRAAAATELFNSGNVMTPPVSDNNAVQVGTFNF